MSFNILFVTFLVPKYILFLVRCFFCYVSSPIWPNNVTVATDRNIFQGIKYHPIGTIPRKQVCHHHPTNSKKLNLQRHLNLHLPWSISVRCRRHFTPHHMWRLLPLHQYLCGSFPPSLHSDSIVLHGTFTAPSCYVPIRDSRWCYVSLCAALSQSVMPGTDTCYPCFYALLRVAGGTEPRSWGSNT